MSTDLRSANLCGGASENKGAFLFFLENPSKKTIQMESLKNVYCEKMGLFRFLAEKIFSVAAREVARRWSARTAARRSGRVWMDAMDCCEAFRAASVCVWMDVPGRVWMDAMEVVYV